MANLQLIKLIAEKKKMALTELAERVGVSEQQIHLMVRKNSTKIETLEKIANVLQVPVSSFFDEEPTAESYHQYGDRNLMAKKIKIDKLDQRTVVKEDKSTEIDVIGEEKIEEKFVMPPDCPDEVKYLIESLQSEVRHIKELLAEKERMIQLYEKMVGK